MNLGDARLVLAWAAVFMAASGPAAAQVRRFDIPAQPASSGIPEFGRQAMIQIIVAADAVKNRTTRAVRGDLEPRQALEQLLAGTGLAVLGDTGRAITLGPAPRAEAKREPPRPQPPSPSPAAILPAAAGPVVPPAPIVAAELLDEVVVTATRQADTVNRVPLSISVVTQRTLDAQGVKTVEDLFRLTPGVTFRRSGGEGNPSVTIRGIGGNGATVGSQTTGIYLDDSALQRRNVNGLITGNGSPFPLLYDLERVEVLRGPQGTLYGGSSQGGTIRFITPQPSFVRYSASGRAELSATKDGGANYEAGFAVGGPIVEDKLGFRISGLYRKTSGYIDALSKYDGRQFARNVNYARARAARLALAWQATPKAKITPALYLSRDYANADSTVWGPTPANSWTGGAVRNGGTSNTAGPVCTMSQAAPSGTCRTTGGVYFAFPDTTIAPFSNAAAPWYGQPYTTGNGRYLSTTEVYFEPSPRKTHLFLPSLTIDYELDGVSVKSITSYVNDYTTGVRFAGGGAALRVTPRLLFGPQPCAAHNNPLGARDVCYTTPDYLPGLPDTFSYYFYNNRRNSISEELRFSSAPSASPLSWVAGIYFLDSRIHLHAQEHSNENNTSLAVRGVPEAWFIGNYGLPGGGDPANAVGDINRWSVDVSDREINLDETEIAAFGEANYNITDKLKITGGVRFTRYHQRFFQRYGGAVAGVPLAGASDANPLGYRPDIPGNSPTNPVRDPNDLRAFALNLAGCPSATDCPLQYTMLSVTENPVTPKIGLSYQFDADAMVYANMSKGFRAGGVNPAVPPAQCAQDLQALGVAAVPATFDGDTVTSYEAGAKLRFLAGRLQLNTSAFWIDWKDVQFNFPLLCGFAFLANAAKATSKGAELQAAGRFGPLTVNLALGYDKAVFTDDVRNPSLRTYLQNKGDNLGVPDWTVALGLQYNAVVPGGHEAYVRADYQYTGAYARNPGPPVTTYDPLTHQGDRTDYWNVRAGVTLGKVEVNLFALNLANSKDYLAKGHGQDSLRITGSTFRPRTIGVQMNYQY